jgi:hypothetical protein
MGLDIAALLAVRIPFTHSQTPHHRHGAELAVPQDEMCPNVTGGSAPLPEGRRDLGDY